MKNIEITDLENVIVHYSLCVRRDSLLQQIADFARWNIDFLQAKSELEAINRLLEKLEE